MAGVQTASSSVSGWGLSSGPAEGTAAHVHWEARVRQGKKKCPSQGFTGEQSKNNPDLLTPRQGKHCRTRAQGGVTAWGEAGATRAPQGGRGTGHGPNAACSEGENSRERVTQGKTPCNWTRSFFSHSRSPPGSAALPTPAPSRFGPEGAHGREGPAMAAVLFLSLVCRESAPLCAHPSAKYHLIPRTPFRYTKV